MRRQFVVLTLLLCLSFVACRSESETLRLATTTSTNDSGLMDTLLPLFEADSGSTVEVIAVGTGEALALGRAGDVDLVLVHARSKEDEFVNEGYGVDRRDVMYNDFVLIGPASDPAQVQVATDVRTALAKIAAAEASFISRGDNSGTHTREQQLWQGADVEPSGDWYQSVGQGMGATISIAEEQQGYTLTDRGTYIVRQQEGLDLVILVERDERLNNPYGVIAVNPTLHEDIQFELAQDFMDWLVSSEGQAAIDAYRIDGQQLFFANAN